MNPFTNAKIIGSGIDPDAYHRQDAKRGEPNFVMTRSQLMEFALCPRRWLAGYGSDDTESTEWGTLIDTMLLDPQRMSKFALRPATYRDNKTGEDKPWNGNSNVCKAWQEAHADKQIVKPDKLMGARSAVDRLTEIYDARELLRCSEKQVLIVAEFHDRATGITIPIKCLLDLMPNGEHPQFGKALADLKTAASANPAQWPRSVNNFNYDAQAALCMDLHAAATDELRTDWIHLIQENVAPYEVLTPLPILSAEFIEQGRSKYLSALRGYALALKTDVWPGYRPTRFITPTGFQVIEPDAWMMKQAMEAIPDVPELEHFDARPKQTADENDLIP